MQSQNFVDRAKITVRGGKGGNGCMSFRREKYVPRGGPDGGNGGNGGHVLVRAVDGVNTLVFFRMHQHFFAANGVHGQGSNLYGKNGEDMVLEVPVGTLVKDLDSGETIADLDHLHKTVCVARGGRGGRGNAQFATSTLRAPRIAEKGVEGEERRILLELKLFADVGLVGFPSVGKSTLISKISNAHPKIADYPFTTVIPNLGVVQRGNADAFVVADIPGLIEGAHDGAGLGFYFLRHIERTAVLVHMLDMSLLERDDPLQDYAVIRGELEAYNPQILEKTELVVLNKIDLCIPEIVEETREKFTRMGKEVFALSAVEGTGIDALLHRLQREVQRFRQLTKPPTPLEEPERLRVDPVGGSLPTTIRLEIRKTDAHTFEVGGEAFENLVKRLDLRYYDSHRRFLSILENSRLNAALRRAGATDGDTVKVAELEFEFVETHENGGGKKDGKGHDPVPDEQP